MFGSKGKWIWDGPGRRWNYWLGLRKTFTAPASEAVLDITADSRYRVWVNGELIGQGPVRGWPDMWFYDSHPVRLNDGENVIAVLAHEFGVGNFQYLPGQPGVLAELRAGDQVVVATDETWRVAEHPGFSRGRLRISCQQGWVEDYDARGLDEGWLQPGFSGTWQAAAAVPGERPLTPRDVASLSEGPIVSPMALRARSTTPPAVWSCSLRANLLPDNLEANPAPIEGSLVVTARAEQAGCVEIETVGGWVSAAGRLRVNGQDCEAITAIAPAWHGTRRHRAKVNAGENRFEWDVSGKYHEWAFHAVVDPGLESPSFSTAPNGRSQPIAGHDLCVNDVTLRFAYARCDRETEAPGGMPWRLAGGTELLLDLGRMTIGYWELDVEAQGGASIEMLAFEAFQDGVPDLPLDMQNTLRYVCATGRQLYRTFWRRGGRYLLLRADAPVTIHDLRVVEATYPVAWDASQVEGGAPSPPLGSDSPPGELSAGGGTGFFRCSDERLNKIWDMCALTTKLCMEDTYVDCPTYEQTFWVGDSRTEGLANYACFGAWDISARCLRLAAHSLKHNKLVESNVPSSWRNVIPAWSFLWAIACEEYAIHSGDVETLRELLPVLEEQGERAWEHVDERGLFAMEAWNLADWAPMDQPGEGVVTSQHLWFIGSLQSLARVYRLLGWEGKGLELRIARLIEGLNEHLWDAERQAYVDCIKADGSPAKISQQNQILALLYNAAGERANTIGGYLTNPPEEMVRVGTPFFSFFWFEALAKLGRFEDILAITREKWGFMLDQGATTCWELFPGFWPSGRHTRSHCHAWSAAPAHFLSAYVLGVRPLSPGYGTVAIEPHHSGLEWAEGSVPTPHGPIWVRWDADGLHYELPPGVHHYA